MVKGHLELQELRKICNKSNVKHHVSKKSKLYQKEKVKENSNWQIEFL